MRITWIPSWSTTLEGAPMHTGEPGNGTQRADRIAGALLGVHAGDALGATLEFSAWSAIRQRYPDGLRDIVGGGPFGWPPGHATLAGLECRPRAGRLRGR